jgi:transcriptional regulator with XRE-family HTH domain
MARGKGLRVTARQANIDPAHLSRIERGLAEPSVSTLKTLADVLGLSEMSMFLAPYAQDHSGTRLPRAS